MWRFAIDTGGTFTDCLGRSPEGRWHRVKVLSSSILKVRIVSGTATTITIASDPPLSDGLVTGWQASQGGWTGRVIDQSGDIVTVEKAPGLKPGSTLELKSPDEAPVLAMRWVTATPQGADLPAIQLRLGTTRGTNALLERSFPPVGLVLTEGFADLLTIGTQQRPDLFARDIERPEPLTRHVFGAPGRLAVDGQEWRALDDQALVGQLKTWRQAGLSSLAVCLMHADVDDRHERRVEDRARELGFTTVVRSSALAPSTGYLRRARTTCVEACLEPVLRTYLDRVRGALAPSGGSLQVMTSAGDLVSEADFRPLQSLLSGPAGGVVGARAVLETPVIAFDMGGTSTDVCRLDDGIPHVDVHRVGQAELAARAVAIETVAAGGGSVCWFDGARLRVGPESAGAQPGPACYGAGGPLTVTDVNLLSGRCDPAEFRLPLDPVAARIRLEALRDEVAAVQGPLDEEALLNGLLDIVDEAMAGAITDITLREGRDPTDYTLVAYGGAGGQHACSVAERLGIRRVVVPADMGILSARGLAGARRARRVERQLLTPFGEVSGKLDSIGASLTAEAREQLPGLDRIVTTATVTLRLAGQEAHLEVDLAGDPSAAFRREHERLYGRALDDDVDLEVVSVSATARETSARWTGEPVSRGGWETGETFDGPQLVNEPHGTTVIPEGWSARIDDVGHLHATCRHVAVSRGVFRVQAVERELFAQRFTQVAREMGVTLQRTTVSTNIRERLDFSCALLDPAGHLVVNAPHIPVHLGALGTCVRALSEHRSWNAGETVVVNHPGFGGSHLPDVTLVSPVHVDDRLVGFVANRAHHAEMGGLSPGSMPADATCLHDEGVVIPPTVLANDGGERWGDVLARLSRGPYPSRDPQANLNDLRAQLQANRRGAVRLGELCRQHGVDTVQTMMTSLRDQARAALECVLRDREGFSSSTSSLLDDGTPLCAAVTIAAGRLTVDFTGSGPVHRGNLNATRAVVTSALVYVLRLLCDEEIPLNEGLLEPVSIVWPGGLLDPDFPEDPRACPAVVGGNVETSQRLVDLLGGLFDISADSQGTMNNLLFGNGRFAYYETLGGGAGATATAPGASGVHVHMTNTAITDPEILERRYPVRLEEFSIRSASGGMGRHRGGDGLVRRVTFLEGMEVSLLTERRVTGPRGRAGGGPGAPGRQWLVRPDGTREDLPGRVSLRVPAGTTLVVETPGGGGWGGDQPSGESPSVV